MLLYDFSPLKIVISEKKDGCFRFTPQRVSSFLEEKVANLLPRSAEFFHLLLANGKEIALVKAGSGQVLPKRLKVDAAISEKKAKSVILSMVVGDCFPLVLFDRKSEKVAIIHAGWKPLFLGILDDVLANFTKEQDFQVSNLSAFIGPGIRVKSYYFTEKPQQADDPPWKDFIKKRAGKWQVDLPAFIKWRLADWGMKEEQIFDTGLDSYSLEKQFFSHRRATLKGEEDGRFLLAVFWPQAKERKSD